MERPGQRPLLHHGATVDSLRDTRPRAEHGHAVHSRRVPPLSPGHRPAHPPHRDHALLPDSGNLPGGRDHRRQHPARIPRLRTPRRNPAKHENRWLAACYQATAKTELLEPLCGSWVYVLPDPVVRLTSSTQLYMSQTSASSPPMVRLGGAELVPLQLCRVRSLAPEAVP